MGDRVVVMLNGRIQQVGTPKEALQHTDEPVRRRLYRQSLDEFCASACQPRWGCRCREGFSAAASCSFRSSRNTTWSSGCLGRHPTRALETARTHGTNAQPHPNRRRGRRTARFDDHHAIECRQRNSTYRPVQRAVGPRAWNSASSSRWPQNRFISSTQRQTKAFVRRCHHVRDHWPSASGSVEFPIDSETVVHAGSTRTNV